MDGEKKAILAHTVPNKLGAYILYTLFDKPRGQEYWERHPQGKVHWKVESIPAQLELLSDELQRRGYTVSVVSVEEHRESIHNA